MFCILNDSAGTQSAKARASEIAALFSSHGMTVTVVTGTGDDIASLCQRALRENHETVVAGGGDGTINCVASALAGTGVTLGVLPMGTLNHFAKDLKIPPGLPEAIANIAAGNVRNVDVGEVNGLIFLNNSSIGLYPQLVREREKLQGGGASKWVAFVRAIGYVLARYRHLNLRLDAGNMAQRRQSTPFLFVGNNRYSTNGSAIGTRERLDEARLWLCMAPRRGPGGLIWLALLALLGRLKDDAFDTIETGECWIETRRRRIDVARDGEVTAMVAPLHYRIRPGALRVLVPVADAPATGQ